MTANECAIDFFYHKTSYLATISSLGLLLGLPSPAAERFAKTTYAFEKKLAKILVPFDSELMIDARKTYNKVKVIQELGGSCNEKYHGMRVLIVACHCHFFKFVVLDN